MAIQPANFSVSFIDPASLPQRPSMDWGSIIQSIMKLREGQQPGQPTAPVGPYDTTAGIQGAWQQGVQRRFPPVSILAAMMGGR